MAARPRSEKNRQILTTRVEAALLKEIKFLSVELERPLNDLFEEAFGDLIKKYKKKADSAAKTK